MFKFMFKHNNSVAFKTITIKKEVYERLVSAKREGESFSDLFDRVIAERRPSIMEFAGAWKNVSDEDVRKLRKEFREGFNKSFDERMKRISKMWKNENSR